MKKILVTSVAVLLLVGLMPQGEVQAARANPGGPGGLLVGCCFGVRTAGQWNEGKDLHFRDWGRLIPVVNIVLAVWDGIQAYEGITTTELAEEYGSNFF